MSDRFMVLYLDAPLQSWGYMSRFMRRTTAGHPTKSGIVGLLCAALGLERHDEIAIAELADMEMTAFVMEPGSRLIDYHTVGGGYDQKQQKMNIPKSADGSTFGTVVTGREYLMDARFGMILKGHAPLIERCSQALRNPCWGLWLGRKSCIPADLIFQGDFDTQEQAFQCLEEIAKRRASDGKRWRRIIEVARFEEGTDTLQDVPLNFEKRTFKPRRISVE